MTPTVNLIRDAESELTQSLRGLNNPQDGICVAMTRTDMRSPGWLATDLLAALGKTTGRNHSADGWAVASAHLLPWLVVDDIDHIIVGYAELLNTAQLISITQFAQLAETNLWYVADTQIPNALADFAKRWNVTETTPEALQALGGRTAKRPTPEDKTSTRPPFPTVDTDSYMPTFLANSRRTMDERDFQRVFRQYLHAFDNTTEWLTDLPETPDEQAVAAHLSVLIDSQQTLAAVTTTIHGMQAAAFRQGLNIKTDPHRFLNRMTETQTAISLTRHQWDLLTASGNTRQCAIAVFASLGISIEEMYALPAAAIASDGSTVRTRDTLHDVPPAARPLLVAHLLYRATTAEPTNPQMLAGSRKDVQLTHRGISLLIDELTHDSGIAFRARYDRWDTQDRSWRQRTGLTITRVAA